MQRTGRAAGTYPLLAVEPMDKYEVIIYWSDEDAAFLAEAPELQGCITHGTTRQEAVENVAEAIDLWAETSLELGHPVPEPKSRRPVPA